MKQWLNGKNIGDLWFSEEPYKVYSAKVTGSATITSIAFYTG
jgi:phage-related protein